MKPTIALLFSSLAVALAAPPKAALTQVHKVYLLPMTNGMDQYLANRLTSLGLFQVVTDPKKADAVFTDRIGEAFESIQAEWFPEQPIVPASDEAEPAGPPEASAPAAPDQPAAPGNPPEQPPTTGHPVAQPPAPAAPPPVAPSAAPLSAALGQKAGASEPEKKADTGGGLKGDRAVPLSTLHRSKGVLFLVDARSRLVLWSIYAPPKNTSAAELDRTATHIAARIQQDLKSR